MTAITARMGRTFSGAALIDADQGADLLRIFDTEMRRTARDETAPAGAALPILAAARDLIGARIAAGQQRRIMKETRLDR